MTLLPKKIYVYNPETLMYEVQTPSRRRRVFGRILMLVLAVAGIAFWFWLYFVCLGQDSPKTLLLRKTQNAWQSEMQLLSRDLDFYDQSLSAIEERDDHVYRSIYGFAEVPKNVRNVGFGGQRQYEPYEEEGASPELTESVRRIESMMKRSFIQSKALDEVGVAARQVGDMVSCVPSVPPVCPDVRVHLSSPFGTRRDPLYGYRSFHSGLDLATYRGNPVYATGDGVVVSAKAQFNGYGNLIEVDHGFGYRTRYAHLNTIEVAEGMKVKRGERIGTVGSSGKSTGPHLHYEVLYRNEKVNPRLYLDMDMGVKEFKDMVEKQEETNDRGKRSTTSELLKRRRLSDEN